MDLLLVYLEVSTPLTSKLSAPHGNSNTMVEIPINQDEDQKIRGKNTLVELKENYKNVQSTELELTNVFNSFISNLQKSQK